MGENILKILFWKCSFVRTAFNTCRQHGRVYFETISGPFRTTKSLCKPLTYKYSGHLSQVISKSILKTIALSHWPICSKFGTVADIPTICVLVANFIDDFGDGNNFGDIFGDGFADRSLAASNNLVQINSKRNPRWPSPTKWISSMTTIPSWSFYRSRLPHGSYRYQSFDKRYILYTTMNSICSRKNYII